MRQKTFPVIDPAATGANIVRLRRARGLSVRDLQTFFGFEEPQAIYKWQKGKSLPSVDNLYALGALLEVPMEEILVSAGSKWNELIYEQQADACCSPHLGVVCPAAVDTARSLRLPQAHFPLRAPAVPGGNARGALRQLPQRAAFIIRPSSRMGRGWRCECGREGGVEQCHSAGRRRAGAEEAGEGLLRCQRPELLYKRGICAVVKCAALWFVCT